MKTLKLELEELQSIVSDLVKNPEEARKLMKAAEKRAEELAEEKAATKAPKSKYKFVPVQTDGTDSVFLVKVKQEFDETKVVDLIKQKVIIDFNLTKKGRKNPVLTVGQAFESIPAKYWKPYELKVITKEMVGILHTPNFVEGIKKSDF